MLKKIFLHFVLIFTGLFITSSLFAKRIIGVNRNPIPMYSIKIVQQPPNSIEHGDNFTIKIYVSKDGKPAINENVTWSKESGAGFLSPYQATKYDKLGNLFCKTDTKGNGIINAKFIDLSINDNLSEECLGNHTIRIKAGDATIITNNISIKIKEGWSDVTGFRHTWTSNQKAILNESKRILKEGYAPLSIYPISSDKKQIWATDLADNDGERLKNCINCYHDFKNKNPAISTPDPSTKSKMVKELSPTYSSGNDANLIIERIINRYNGRSAPKTNQEILDYLGIRAQCKETRDRITLKAINVTRTYNSGEQITNPKDLRAGMIGDDGTKHTFIVSAIKWDAKGNVVKIKVIDSNYNTTFNNPGGDIPWERRMRQHEENYSFGNNYQRF
ncbi:MAG: hypothetical protein V9E90_08190 [Saprospiraceae bacterium]